MRVSVNKLISAICCPTPQATFYSFGAPEYAPALVGVKVGMKDEREPSAASE